MPIQLSKILVALEGVLFCAIPGIFLLFWGLPFFGFAIASGSFAAAALIALLGATLISAIVVICRFLNSGAEGLRLLKRRWWVLCAIGAVLAIVGAIFIAIDASPYVVSDDIDVLLRAAGIGVPLLLTYGHLLLEYFLRGPVLHAA